MTSWRLLALGRALNHLKNDVTGRTISIPRHVAIFSILFRRRQVVSSHGLVPFRYSQPDVSSGSMVSAGVMCRLRLDVLPEARNRSTNKPFIPVGLPAALPDRWRQQNKQTKFTTSSLAWTLGALRVQNTVTCEVKASFYVSLSDASNILDQPRRIQKEARSWLECYSDESFDLWTRPVNCTPLKGSGIRLWAVIK